MSASRAKPSTVVEREVFAFSGWVMLVINIAIVAGAIAFFLSTARAGAAGQLAPGAGFFRILLALLWFAGGIIMFIGHFTLQPNEARVLILFGAYKGTVRKSGFHWANPFYSRRRGKGPFGIAPQSDSPFRGLRVTFSRDARSSASNPCSGRRSAKRTLT